MSFSLEASRTRALLGWLNRQPRAFFVKIHGGPFQPRLIDIIGCYHSCFIALEVKRPHNKPTPRQLMTMRDLTLAGALCQVVWEREDCQKVLKKVLDSLAESRDTAHRPTHLAPKRIRKGITTMPSRKNRAGKSGTTAVKSKSKAKEELEELEDLDELDDLEDELDEDELDEEDEEAEEDEDEEEPAPVKSRKSATKTKAKTPEPKTKATKGKGATKVAAPAAKSKGKQTSAKKGNADNLVGRRITEGNVGAAALAVKFGVDARSIRAKFRSLEIPKNASGLYEWKPNSRELASVEKKIAAALK